MEGTSFSDYLLSQLSDLPSYQPSYQPGEQEDETGLGIITPERFLIEQANSAVRDPPAPPTDIHSATPTTTGAVLLPSPDLTDNCLDSLYQKPDTSPTSGNDHLYPIEADGAIHSAAGAVANSASCPVDLYASSDDIG